VATLHGAVALTEVDAVAVRVARGSGIRCGAALEIFLDVHGAVPNADRASLRAIWKLRVNSSASRATRIPLPPPPADALMITGKPIFTAKGQCVPDIFHRPRVPGTTGTPFAIIVARAVALSPIVRICSGVGPINVIFARRADLGKLGVLARKP